MKRRDEPAESEAAGRRRRLAEALRDNLKRRKSQSRSRRSDAEPPKPRDPERD